MLSQIAAISVANLKSLPARRASAFVFVVAIAGVVSVLIALFAMVSCFTKTITGSARSDRVIVLARGSTSESSSNLSREAARFVDDAPGVRQHNGERAIVTESLVIVTLPQKTDNAMVELTLRGTSQRVSIVRPEARIVEGRMFQSGKREIIVGRQAQRTISGIPQLGGTVSINNSDWQVVGVFTSGGDIHESEIWGDVDLIVSDFHRNTFQSATVLLTSTAEFAAFSSYLSSNPSVAVDAKAETEYFQEHSRRVNVLLRTVARIAGTIMALGALMAAVNTMTNSLHSRLREIGVLAALGFGPLPVAVSMLVEAVLLAAIGVCVGSALMWILLDGQTMSTLLRGSSSRVVFEFRVQPRELLIGSLVAVGVAIVSCIAPMIRARTLPITALLRHQ